MGYIIRTDDDGDIRSRMRRAMRGGNYRHYGTTPMMHGDETWEHGYRMGYREAVEDWEDENYRRSRDSKGRYI